MKIREAIASDRDAISNLYQSAFPAKEGEVVGTLAMDFLELDKAFSLVVEFEDSLVGHVSWSPVFFPGSESILPFILAPLAVHPKHQKKGLGSRLVKAGLDRLEHRGMKLCFVYGDPDFYGRFGFQEDIAREFLPPYPLKYPFGWQAVMFKKERLPESREPLTCMDPLCHPDLW